MRFLSLIALTLAAVAPAAELTMAEKRMAQAIGATVRQAGSRYAAGDFEQAGKKIREAIKQIETALQQGSSDLYDALEPAMKRIENAHAMLEFEGVSLPPFRRPPRPAASTPLSPAPRPPRSRGSRSSAPQPEQRPTESILSFTETVAPILVARCGRCHVSDRKGGFDMSTYAALMKGPPQGVVIFAGDTVGSRLIETIESGDMPRGGGQVSAAELRSLKAWIAGGAKFDGSDPSAPIVATATPSPSASPRPPVRRPTGGETVSFAGDVAPLLVAHCNGCHLDAMQTRGGLRMDTFSQLLRGGDSGAVISPGKGETSLLVQKLRGTVGQQMPAGGRPPLAENEIKLIATWIDEGATLDGASESQPLRVMSQLAWAASASSPQLSQRRADLADQKLGLVTPSGGNIESKTTDHFLIIGPTSPGTIDLVAELAEAQMSRVRSVVSAAAGEDFFRGRATIFVMPKRYDYSEFARMAERRDVPSSWTGHWRFDGIDAYVALVATDRDQEDTIADRLTGPLVSLAVATRGGNVPRWLAEGIGVATAARHSSTRDREARRRAEVEISQALAAMSSAKQFMEGKMSPQQSDRIGAAIAASMLDRNHRRKFDGLLRNLGGGQSFEKAFAESFGVAPTEFVQAWMKWVRGG